MDPFSSEICAERHARVDARLRILEEHVHGNGKDGLVARVAVHATSITALGAHQNAIDMKIEHMATKIEQKQDKLQERQNQLFMYAYIAMGAIAVLQFIGPWLMDKIR